MIADFFKQHDCLLDAFGISLERADGLHTIIQGKIVQEHKDGFGISKSGGLSSVLDISKVISYALGFCYNENEEAFLLFTVGREIELYMQACELMGGKLT